MIIVGYPCIGKSTYANSHGYNVIDLESSNFIKDGSWVESYCNVPGSSKRKNFCGLRYRYA